MKKTLFSALFIVVFGVYALLQRSQNSSLTATSAESAPATSIASAETKETSPAVAQNETTSTSNSPGTETNTTPIASQNPTPPSVPSPSPIVVAPKNSIFKDGTFTGTSADAYYGYIQVQVTTKNDKIVDVAYLDYPRDRGESVRINSRAMPRLKSEAIRAQSANVDTVSGATDSSGAFRQSLSSALSQAHV